MATTIVTKKGSGAPAASDLVEGELAVDTTNGRLYTENSSAAVVELGSNPSGNITFGDNGKAIFGAGSDLQIYHSGSHSFISEAGTGDLYIGASNNIALMNAAFSENKLLATTDGALTLYHNGSAKLATTATGVDITGSATMSGGALTSTVKFLTNTTVSGSDATIFRPADNTMAFSTNGAERMRIGPSGGVSLADDNELFFNASSSSQETRLGWKYGGTLQSWIEREHSDGSLVFGNQGSERMKIGADGVAHFNGDVKVLSGDIQMGSGRGINFSPNSNAGGMTSETLDDYEEGLWTLTITTSGTGESVSIGSTTGTYTKIGRQVTATIYTSGVNVSAAGSGAVLLGGLPFTCSNGIQFYAVPSFGHTTLFSYEPDGYVTINANYITVTRVGTTTSNALSVGNPRYMMMTVTYFTDS